MPEKCRGCGKEIIWLNHKASGKPAPIEAETNIEGNVLINLETKQYRIATAEERYKVQQGGVPKLHMPHFATCSKAQNFKK